jgi:hypothetical protein
MSASSEFSSILLCDEVREEINHKRIVIGVYSGDVVVNNLPSIIGLSFYIEHHPKTAGKRQMKFTILLGDREIAQVGMEAEALVSGISSAIPFPKIQFPLEKEEEIKLEVSVDGGKRERLLTKRIRRGTVATSSSIVPPPPS